MIQFAMCSVLLCVFKTTQLFCNTFDLFFYFLFAWYELLNTFMSLFSGNNPSDIKESQYFSKLNKLYIYLCIGEYLLNLLGLKDPMPVQQHWEV